MNNSIININKYSILELDSEDSNDKISSYNNTSEYSENILSELYNVSPKNYLNTP